MADACVANSNLRLKWTIYYFCDSCFPKEYRGNSNKNSKLETPQNLHVKQGRIPVVPALQVGKLRHRPLKSFQQSSKQRDGELEKDPEL